MSRRRPRSTHFPYTTLFRSLRRERRVHHPPAELGGEQVHRGRERDVRAGQHERCPAHALHTARLRSEEHTSELQSQSNLVCRLLLEKKKLDHTQVLMTTDSW